MLVTHLGGSRYEFRGGKGVQAIGTFTETGEGQVNELVPNPKYRPTMANIHNVAWILKFVEKGRLVEILKAARLAAPRPIRLRDVKWEARKS